MNDKSCGLLFLFFLSWLSVLSFSKIRISRDLDVHSKKLVRKLRVILKQNTISSVHLDEKYGEK